MGVAAGDRKPNSIVALARKPKLDSSKSTTTRLEGREMVGKREYSSF